MKWSWKEARQRRCDGNAQPPKWKCMSERNLLAASLTLPGKVNCHQPCTPADPRHFQPALAGSLAFWEWRSVMKKTAPGKYLGVLYSDVWQNESMCPWKWECRERGRGVSSTRRWFAGWGVEVIFSGSSGMCCCQQNFSHLLIPERKWL